MNSQDLKRLMEELTEKITKEIRMAAEEQIRANADDTKAISVICDMNNEAVNAVRRVIKEVLE